MDRAEVLHALSYDIELNWKNNPVKFKFVNLIEKSIRARASTSLSCRIPKAAIRRMIPDIKGFEEALKRYMIYILSRMISIVCGLRESLFES